MELCVPQSFMSLPNYRPINRAHLQWRPTLLVQKPQKSRFNSGLFDRTGSAIRAVVEDKDDKAKSETEAAPRKVEVRTVKIKAEPEVFELYVPPTAEEKEDKAVTSKSETEAAPRKVEVRTVKIKAEPEVFELYVPPTAEEKDDK